MAQVFSTLVSRGHAIRRGGCEIRAPILDQPSIGVADGHVEKVDRYHGDDRPIWTVDIVHGKERINDRHIGLDEADPVVGERRLRAAVDGLLRLGTEVLYQRDPPLQILTLWRNESSVFFEQRCAGMNTESRTRTRYIGLAPNCGRRRPARRAWRDPGRNRRRCRSPTDRPAACAPGSPGS